MRLIDGDGINLALVERGQSDKRFKWGETIRYTPSEVQQIINEDVPTVDAVTIEELEKLRDEMAKCEGGDSYLVYYGHEFRTDMGYAFDGIDMLIECLKIKYRGCGNA